MHAPQTVDEYYTERGIDPGTAGLFNVFESEVHCTAPMYYNRRDFYKISLLHGTSRLRWPHNDIEIDRPALIFFNPVTPFAWSPVSKKQAGYFCLFKREFLQQNSRDQSLHRSPLFKIGSNPVFFLEKVQLKYIGEIFSRMLTEMRSGYAYKHDLIRNHLNLIIHEALKMEQHVIHQQKNASERLAALFLDLLEQQFPIDSPDRTLKLKTAGDYASALAVHVNHLNYVVKEITGKSTTAHIADRIILEAKALLRHTDWPVSEIAYCLGFDYASSFQTFVKKRTGRAPGSFRTNIL